MTARAASWIGLTQVARELGTTRKRAVKDLRRVRWVFPPEGSPARWDARVVDLIHAMRGQPHRPLDAVHEDWLTRYLEDPHARPDPAPPRPTRPPAGSTAAAGT